MKALQRGFMMIMLLATGYVAGVLHTSWDTAGAQATEDNAFPLLHEAIDYVESNFVMELPDAQTVEYELIRAYLATLDDSNTFFIEPAVAASESDVLAGRYGGVGVDIQIDERGQYVLYPFEDSTARDAGIQPGDVLIAINGEPLVLGTPLDVVRQALRGEIIDGAGVTLALQNLASLEERELFVPFGEVLVPSVMWRTLFEAPELGYIHIRRFTARTPEEFAQAVTELRAEGVQGIVLDLRDNPGGLLQESLQIAGEFFDGGVLSVERRISGDSEEIDIPGGILLDMPVVTLINRGTASGAEIVGGALQDRGRSVLIGQQTFGKGSIQSIFPLSDASSIHVTVALWYTPDGTELETMGLTPDIPMIPDETGRDVELGEAIRYLREEVNMMTNEGS